MGRDRVDSPDPAKYELPDEQTLVKYLALLREVILMARASEHKQSVALLDAIENVPDLLCRWSDMDEEMVAGELRGLEEKFGYGEQFTSILRDGPRAGWQTKWEGWGKDR